jgi:hypothetical protein
MANPRTRMAGSGLEYLGITRAFGSSALGFCFPLGGKRK